MESPDAEHYQALTTACGLVDRAAAGRLELLGADRHRFLNAYVTCDVKGLAPGHGAYGFFTSAQGRILSDAVVLAHEDRLWVELPAGQDEAIAGHLKRYLLADRVELRGLDDQAPLALVGPESAAVLGDAAPPEGEWRHHRTTFSGLAVTVVRDGRFGVPAFTLWTADLPRLDSVLSTSVAAVGPQAVDVVRVEAGVPWFGRDFGPESFPQETGLEAAVSYTKGCYLGQEVVARIHYRGGVQKILRTLAFEPGQAPAPGTVLTYEDREAGVCGTVVGSPARRQPLGLAILHKRAAEPGTRLQFTGGEALVLA